MSTRDERDRERADLTLCAFVICDDAPDLFGGLAAAAAAAGVTLKRADCGALLRSADASLTPCLALVRLASPSSEEPTLDAIRQLAAKGVHVISYGEHADGWPLGARCRALLAGACTIFDSVRADFLETLHEKVAHLCDTESRRARDEQDVRLTFRNLGIVGESEASRRIFRWIARISRLSDLHTLITGETGTGKQLVAEATHRLDPKRHDGPFVVLNCAAVSPGLAESELFGHRRGAFTGADHERKGLIRAAHGGVLFLDEIGELDLALQAKLLRVVQDGRVLGLGADQESAVDVRVLAATNRDLAGMVRERTFREDLFHRLNILSVFIPPLRERPDDIAALVKHFLTKHQGLGTGEPLQAGEDFMAALTHADLTGNARQVENIVRRAIVSKEDASPLGLGDLPPEIWSQVSQARAEAPTRPSDLDSAYLSRVLAGHGWNLSRSLASCERSLVEVALQAARGNQSETARLLGITPRCVYNKLRKHHLSRTSA
jgi:DNA-binding NtrC family response regulator